MYGIRGLLYISLIGRDDRGTGGSDTLLLFTSMKTKPLEDVGMAVPKTAQTRYMDGSVQATQGIGAKVTPSLHLFFIFVSSIKLFSTVSQQMFHSKNCVGMGLLV